MALVWPRHWPVVEHVTYLHLFLFFECLKSFPTRSLPRTSVCHFMTLLIQPMIFFLVTVTYVPPMVRVWARQSQGLGPYSERKSSTRLRLKMTFFVLEFTLQRKLVFWTDFSQSQASRWLWAVLDLQLFVSRENDGLTAILRLKITIRRLFFDFN